MNRTKSNLTHNLRKCAVAKIANANANIDSWESMLRSRYQLAEEVPG